MVAGAAAGVSTIPPPDPACDGAATGFGAFPLLHAAPDSMSGTAAATIIRMRYRATAPWLLTRCMHLTALMPVVLSGRILSCPAGPNYEVRGDG